MSIHDRVRQVRQTLKMTQKDFGARIAVAQSYLTNLETGKRDITEKIIKIICSEFGVNERWLRTGDGEMFNQITRADAIANFIHSTLSTETDTFQKRFITMLSELNTAQWEVLEEMALLLSNQSQSTSQEQTSLGIEAELASYRRELELEKTAKEKSEASHDTKGA